MRNEQGSSTDESDGGYLESVGGQEVLYNPHHLRRGEDSALAEDEHLTQTIGPDADQCSKKKTRILVVFIHKRL